MKKTMVRINLFDLEVIKIEDKLQEIYKQIGCDMIAITNRKIGGKYYSVISDDNALLYGVPTVKIVPNVKERTDEDLKILNDYTIFGNGDSVHALIAGPADEEGDLTSLTPEDIENIKNAEGLACDPVLNQKLGLEPAATICVVMCDTEDSNGENEGEI